VFAVAYVAAVISIHRAGVFGHEVAHRYDTRNLWGFNLLWDLTLGLLILYPAARFVKPHRIHHSPGTFRTAADPQYLLLRSDRRLAVFVFVLAPVLMPLVHAFMTVSASLTGDRVEAAIERFANRHGMTTGILLPERHEKRVRWLSRYYMAGWALYVWLAPETLGLMYAVLVGGWVLTTLRIPLEHRMESLLEASDRRDHVLDSFTIASPFAELLQPLALKYHTAHHMYPGVPYHNLAALHRELMAESADYRASVVSFWDVVLGRVPEQRRSTSRNPNVERSR
jgi:fatty acid desaturase